MSVLERPVALCGFMGVGKTTIGRRAAAALGVSFHDVDEVVAERLGQSIVSLFQSGKEAAFRAAEKDVVEELVAQTPPGIISLGGGALMNKCSARLIATRCLLVHLDQTWEDLAPALAKLRARRPLLIGRSDEEIHLLYLERRGSYEAAELTVTLRREGTALGASLLVAAIEHHLGGAKGAAGANGAAGATVGS